MTSKIPVAVLVARLEHELETARLHLEAGEPAYKLAFPVAQAQSLAKQIRESL